MWCNELAIQRARAAKSADARDSKSVKGGLSGVNRDISPVLIALKEFGRAAPSVITTRPKAHSRALDLVRRTIRSDVRSVNCTPAETRKQDEGLCTSTFPSCSVNGAGFLARAFRDHVGYSRWPEGPVSNPQGAIRSVSNSQIGMARGARGSPHSTLVRVLNGL